MNTLNSFPALAVRALQAAALLACLAAPMVASAEDAAATAAAPADAAAAPAGMAAAPADAAAAAGVAGSAAMTAATDAAATDAAVTESTTAEGTTKKAQVENPYGLGALWTQGDFVSRGVLVILGIMSFGSWLIFILRMIDSIVIMRHAKTATNRFWETPNLHEGMEKLEPHSAFRAIAESGLKAADHHDGRLTDRISINEWIEMSLQRAVTKAGADLQSGLSFLATVGSTSPFVGLFGTVLGILHALIGIGIAGQASIDKVAGPVGEALIMTAFGLAVAVPAVLFYNYLVQRNKVALDRLRDFAADIQAVLLSNDSARDQRRGAA